MAKEIKKQQIAQLVAKSQNHVANLLSEYAIHQPYNLEIRQFRGYRSRFMGLLRAETEFSKRPVIWINQNLISMMKRYEVPEWEYENVVTDTILHEIGHIIYKRSLKNGPDSLVEFLGNAVEASQGVNCGFSGDIEEDPCEAEGLEEDLSEVEDLEEDFCEAFALAMTGRRPCPEIFLFLKEYSRIYVSSDPRLSGTSTPICMLSSDSLNNSPLPSTPPALPFECLAPEGVLYFFDAPLLFTMTSETRTFLCPWVSDDEPEQFLLAEVDDQLLKDVSENTTPLRAAFTSSGAWLVSVDKDLRVLKADWLGKEAIPEELLPVADAYLNSVHKIPHG
jgi:hypothetical protein